MIDEQVALLEQPRSSKQFPPTSTRLDHMISHLNAMLSKSNGVIKQNISTNFSYDQLEKMNQLKPAIIRQSIITAINMVNNFIHTALNRNYYESQPSGTQNAVTYAMATR
ncbi:unnamed protein product [Adineta steineri]|uniref:Uncharacterized protein n=1 Tax=Adineta steineri TaxID=433720 RepID=A0A813WW89_9BILA|nr:unnamed protein product [Adineta steineri]